MPDQNRVLEGLKREDLFTVVFEQVFTDTARYADVVLPATTFLEHYDIAKSYGPITLQLVRPVIEPVGEARTNARRVLGARRAARRRPGRGRDRDADADHRTDAATASARELIERGVGDAAARRRADPVRGRVSADAGPQGRPVPEGIAGDAPAGLYGYQPDPATERFPLALISPATEKTDLVHARASCASAPPCSTSIPTTRRARGIAQNDPVRVFNALGELHCPANAHRRRPARARCRSRKGVWRKNTYNGSTSNALVPDSLTDLGAGACFNDARVQVALLGRH